MTQAWSEFQKDPEHRGGNCPLSLDSKVRLRSGVTSAVSLSQGEGLNGSCLKVFFNFVSLLFLGLPSQLRKRGKNTLPIPDSSVNIGQRQDMSHTQRNNNLQYQ
jgi:hypothetical protein